MNSGHSRQALYRGKGFTIVELLIVVVVIAILATITVVAYNGIRMNAQSSAIAQGLKQMDKSFRLWATDESLTEWPPDFNNSGGIFLSEMIEDTPALKRYLQSVPSVPGVETDEWFYDNDGDTKPTTCWGAYSGVNIVIRYVPNQALAQQVDDKADDGDLNCGTIRYENNIIFYALDFDQTITP